MAIMMDSNSGPAHTMDFRYLPKTKRLKRPRELSIAITDARPAKKNCRLHVGALSVPENDGSLYEEELRKHFFYTFCPSDRTNLQKARRRGYLDRLMYGMCGNTVVERLVLDRKTSIPWQIPKVTVEYKKIDYVADGQHYTARCREDDGEPVSPTTLLAPDLMSRVEYNAALEVGNPSVAVEGKHLFEFCLDADIGWLEYQDR